MGLGNIVDEFLNQHSLPHTSTSEQTSLSATSIRGEEINDLDGFSNDIHDVSERSGADWNRDGGAGINHFCSTGKTFGTIHGNSADKVFAQMRSNLEDETTATKVLNLKSVKDWREVVCPKLDTYRLLSREF
jgi:hypothetical protein